MVATLDAIIMIAEAPKLYHNFGAGVKLFTIKFFYVVPGAHRQNQLVPGARWCIIYV